MQLDMYPELLKQILRSKNTKKVDLMLCLDDLLEDGSEEQNESTDWLKAINPFVLIT